ncbi:CPBP family intramembrane metalloprotease [Actinomadura sp. ATCC 31491]|uniref:CPBP family intramembrane metalloprotease n=1 Tax=Actinomadura luzonensis TaxID=2805427 RepID=A0ABT0G1R1_9ACTN|nr:CPBP family intramembrane glutamic endopeptidase [Actinomadura luzonensis]MCK2218559.1 CPBP family intramembrane metalloprotease [Actinomadura luzonensis]
MRHDISCTVQRVWVFVLLVFVFTVPFAVAGFVAEAELVPGVPLTGLAVVCPALAAFVLAFRTDGAAGVRALARRAFDAGRVRRKAWFVPALLLYPAVVVVSYALLRLSGATLPDARVSVTSTALLAAGFLAGALLEELGWSGYATEPLRARYGVAWAGLILGAVWAVWHWTALLQVGRPLSWIAWWSLGTVASRVVMVWLFGHMGGSVFAMALFHMTSNLAWQLFPVAGSHFPVALVSALTAGVAVLVLVVDRRTPVAAPPGG